MQVSIPPELIPFVDQLVQTGAFYSADSVVHAALTLLRDDHIKFEELKRSLREAQDELDRGGGEPFDVEEIKRKGRELFAIRHDGKSDSSF
jgi:putative addiction module CopG family antidote